MASRLIDAIDRLSGKLTRARLAFLTHVRESRISSPEIPRRLYRNGRIPDNKFRFFHSTYFRFSSEDCLGSRLIPARIQSLNMSVNWSKYSRPLDVIIRHPTCGIARLFAGRLPAILPKELQEGEKHHKFCLDHDPLDDNYSHCQIVSFKDGKRISKNSAISNKEKKEFRALVSDYSFIILDSE